MSDHVIPGDIFISLRVKDKLTMPMAVAFALRDQLRALGHSVVLIDAKNGDDVFHMVTEAIVRAALVLIIGSEDYGEKTQCGFSSYQELKFVWNAGRPFFVLQLCENFKQPAALFTIGNGAIFSHRYRPVLTATNELDPPLPPSLVPEIQEAHRKVLSGFVAIGNELAGLRQPGSPPLPRAPLGLLGLSPTARLDPVRLPRPTHLDACAASQPPAAPRTQAHDHAGRSPSPLHAQYHLDPRQLTTALLFFAARDESIAFGSALRGGLAGPVVPGPRPAVAEMPGSPPLLPVKKAEFQLDSVAGMCLAVGHITQPGFAERARQSYYELRSSVVARLGLTTENFTVSVWFRPLRTARDWSESQLCHVWSLQDVDGEDVCSLSATGPKAGGDVDFRLRITLRECWIQLADRDGSQSDDSDDGDHMTAIDISYSSQLALVACHNWTMLTVCVEGGVPRLYANGVEQVLDTDHGADSDGQFVSSPIESLLLGNTTVPGRDSLSPAEPAHGAANGLFRNLILWGRALSLDEVCGVHRLGIFTPVREALDARAPCREGRRCECCRRRLSLLD